MAKLKIIQAIKMKLGNYPVYWEDRVAFVESRNGILINIPRSRLKLTDKAPLINAMRLFNILPKDKSGI